MDIAPNAVRRCNALRLLQPTANGRHTRSGLRRTIRRSILSRCLTIVAPGIRAVPAYLSGKRGLSLSSVAWAEHSEARDKSIAAKQAISTVTRTSPPQPVWNGARGGALPGSACPCGSWLVQVGLTQKPNIVVLSCWASRSSAQLTALRLARARWGFSNPLAAASVICFIVRALLFKTQRQTA